MTEFRHKVQALIDKHRVEFRQEMEHIVNGCSMENGSNTPDFILAQ